MSAKISFIFKGTTVSVIKGDITLQDTDAIVNAANSSLIGGGGVDGAIHKAGGAEILAQCKEIRKTLWPVGLPTGKAVITTGGKLRAKFVIHTVGPVWRGGSQGEQRDLSESYVNCVKLAASKGLKSISFPSLSTGAYGFPIETASKIALEAVRDFLQVESTHRLNEVRFILFTNNDFGIYSSMVLQVFTHSVKDAT